VSKEINIVERTWAATISIGDIIQWRADDNSDLEVYEICFPPYEPGRFKNLS
jgi:hypothetical protein